MTTAQATEPPKSYKDEPQDALAPSWIDTILALLKHAGIFADAQKNICLLKLQRVALICLLGVPLVLIVMGLGVYGFFLLDAAFAELLKLLAWPPWAPLLLRGAAYFFASAVFVAYAWSQWIGSCPDSDPASENRHET